MQYLTTVRIPYIDTRATYAKYQHLAGKIGFEIYFEHFQIYKADMNQILHKSQDVMFKTLVHDPIGKRHSLKKLETRVTESDGNFSFRSSLFER